MAVTDLAVAVAVTDLAVAVTDVAVAVTVADLALAVTDLAVAAAAAARRTGLGLGYRRYAGSG